MKLRYKIVSGIFIAAVCSWSIFQAREYFTGKKYIAYLKTNMQSVASASNPEFEILDEDLQENHLLLIGEIHGIKAPQQLDPQLFGYLNRTHNFNTYLLEMDVSQAFYMNRYNQTGDDSLLKRVLSNWVVRPGRENQDYFKRFRDLRRIYQEGPGFTYLGNNNLSDPELLSQHLSEVIPEIDWGYDPNRTDSLNLISIGEKLSPVLSDSGQGSVSKKTRVDLRMIQKNIGHALEGTPREEVLTGNLQDLYDYYDLKDHKVYGFYGLGHTLKAPTSAGYEAMASRLKHSDSWFDNHMLSANFIFTDSHMAIASQALPSLLQDDAPQTRLSVSHDNIWLSYLFGVEDLKRITNRHSTTIFKLNGEDSPYRGSKRLFSMMQLIPMGQILEAGTDYSSADYSDYVIFVRDSDWAEPIKARDWSESQAAPGSLAESANK